MQPIGTADASNDASNDASKTEKATVSQHRNGGFHSGTGPD
ncbi:MAG: hypothetical protein ACI3W9_06035 [Eubacteriales bacterium]